MVQYIYRFYLTGTVCLVVFISLCLNLLPSGPAMRHGQHDLTDGTVDYQLRTSNLGRPYPKLQRSPYTYKFNTIGDIQYYKHLDEFSNRTFMQLTSDNYLINCSNVDEIRIGKMLGHGKYKSTYIGTFRGTTVAVKVVTRRFGSSNTCAKTILSQLHNASLKELKYMIYFVRCKHNSPVDSMVYEIVNHAVLDFQNIVKNLGYCIRDVDANNTDNNSILSQGLISVFEFGDPFCFNKLTNRPFLERVFHCREMAHLLELTEHSLVGSVGYTDMHERHFMMVNGRVKVIDLDTYVTPVETKCGPLSEISMKERLKKRKRQRYVRDCSALRVNVSCVEGLCKDGNAKDNLFTFTKFFFTRILDYDTIPPDVLVKIRPFLDDMNELKLTARELRIGFDTLMTGNLTLYDVVWGDRVKDEGEFSFLPADLSDDGNDIYK